MDMSQAGLESETNSYLKYKIKLLIPCSLQFLFIAYIFLLKRFSNLFLHSYISFILVVLDAD